MLADQFEAALKQRSQSRDSSEEVDYNSGNNYQLEADFDSALKKAHNLVMEALEKQISPGDGGALSEESLENISSWEYLFKSSVQSLNVEELCDILLNIITCAVCLSYHHFVQIRYIWSFLIAFSSRVICLIRKKWWTILAVKLPIFLFTLEGVFSIFIYFWS